MLYIRRQDKKSIEPFIGINIYQVSKECWRLTPPNTDFHSYGEYKSEERCLEILDEIQAILTPQMIINMKQEDYDKIKCIPKNTIITTFTPETEVNHFTTDYVYQMPEE